MVDNSELKFIAKVIRNKSRFSCHQRSYSSILPGQNNTFNPLKIQIIEPIHESIEFSSPLSSSPPDYDFVPIDIPSHRNSNINNTYPSDHPRRTKTHSHASHSLSTFFEVKYHYLSLNPYLYENISERQHNRLKFSVCGKEWSTKKSVTQLIFYWETVFLIGAKAARRCAGWGRTF